MSKTLYIHIGTGKTGTSAIQKFVESNESDLRIKHGFNYVKSGRSNSKHRSLDFNARRKLDNYVEVVCDLLKAAKKEIVESACSDHLISDEDFPGLSAVEIQYLQNILAPEVMVRVVVYLRRQDEYVESWYSQIVKTGAYTADIHNLYDRLAAGSLLDYSAMLNPWESVFGRENILVKAYEPFQFKNGSLFDDFMSLFDIDITDLEKPTAEVNTSLTRDKILFLRKLARNGMVDLIDNKLINRLKLIETKGDSKFVLSGEIRHEIVLKYLDSNKAVANRYLEKEDLFFAPLPLELKAKWLPRSEVPDTIFLEMLKYVCHNQVSE